MPAFVAFAIIVAVVVVHCAAVYAAWNFGVGALFDVTHIGMLEMFFLTVTVRIVDDIVKWLGKKLTA